MGFDDMRPRAKVYDTWGLIGSRHGVDSSVSEATSSKSDDELEEGDPCPGCDRPLGIVTWSYPGGGTMQLGCKFCERGFGPCVP